MANDLPPDPAVRRSADGGASAGSARSAQKQGDRGPVPADSGSRKAASRGSSPSGSTPAGPGRTVLDDVRIRRALTRIAHEILESSVEQERLYLVAIPNGGVPLGRILVENLREIAGIEPPLGILDTTLYRDDLTSRGMRPRLRRTEMPSSVDDRVVVLVEDVVNTGRTIRAAMDALMDFGRPRSVKVVALVDRGHRELPIKIDHVGKNIPTQPGETVQLEVEGDVDDPASTTLEVIVLPGPSAEEGDPAESRSGRGA